jgi:UPF0716 protein FxsA
MVKWIIPAILMLPLAEIAAFVTVASWIGFGWALLLALATTFCGVWVLRRAGRDGLARFRGAMAARADFDLGAGTFLTVLGGLLLVLPGFITDVLGGLVLIGPLRRRLVALLRPSTAAGRRGGAGAAEGVVDLDPEEWRQLPERQLDTPRRDAGRD